MFTSSRSAASSRRTVGATDPFRPWCLEGMLAWLHVANAPLCLLLLVVIPGVSRPLTLALALLLACGAAGEWLLLRRPHDPAGLRAVRGLATALEWLAGLGVLALCALTPASEPAPALLRILLLLTGVRYRLPGLLFAVAGAELALATLFFAETQFLGQLTAGDATRLGLQWGLLVGLMAVPLGIALDVADQARRQATARPTPMPTPHFSAQEATVLALLLVEPELTYAEIGRRRGIKEATVKTYVERLGEKLGVPHGGRRAITQAVRERGLAVPRPDA